MPPKLICLTGIHSASNDALSRAAGFANRDCVYGRDEYISSFAPCMRQQIEVTLVALDKRPVAAESQP